MYLGHDTTNARRQLRTWRANGNGILQYVENLINFTSIVPIFLSLNAHICLHSSHFLHRTTVFASFFSSFFSNMLSNIHTNKIEIRNILCLNDCYFWVKEFDK